MADNITDEQLQRQLEALVRERQQCRQQLQKLELEMQALQAGTDRREPQS